MPTLKLKHIAETPDSTASELMLNGKRLCFILEDGYRAVKVPGKTRIPAGRYELFPRQSGGFWGRYKKRFGHDFVIGFRSVPNFKWILIHIGNSNADTAGCLLTGTEQYLANDGNYMVAGSTDAYLMLHELMGDLFKQGPVFIEIERLGDPTVDVDPEDPKPPIEPEDPPQVDDPKEPKPGQELGCTPSAVGLALIALLIISIYLL